MEALGFWIVMDVRPRHPPKAEYPMLVTDLGKVMEISSVQLAKA